MNHSSAQARIYGLKSGQWQALFYLSLLMVAVVLCCLHAPDALAQPIPKPRHPSGTCTTDPQFQIPPALLVPGNGILSTIAADITNVLYAVVTYIYIGLLAQEEVRGILALGIIIYIMIYGIMFTFGMIQATVYDFFGRLIKLGIVYWLLGGVGMAPDINFTMLNKWLQLLTMMWRFFNQGTDAIIVKATEIIIGGINSPFNTTKPLAVLDDVLASALSAKMIVTILATFFTGPYGVLFAILLIMSLASLFKALFTAIWVYLMGLILRTFLIALSPIFIGFMLFNRTRPIFDGWLNQLVNACLQPIFLFVFFAFFIALMKVSLSNILSTPVCWSEWQDSMRGTPFSIHFWRFTVWNGSLGQWEPYGGSWSWTGASGAGSPPFPLNLMDILIFLLLAQLAGRFNNIVIMIASEIAGASTNLATMQGPLSNWMSGSRTRAPSSGVRGLPQGYTGSDPALARQRLAGGLMKDGLSGSVSRQISSTLTGNRTSAGE